MSCSRSEWNESKTVIAINRGYPTRLGDDDLALFTCEDGQHNHTYSVGHFPEIPGLKVKRFIRRQDLGWGDKPGRLSPPSRLARTGTEEGREGFRFSYRLSMTSRVNPVTIQRPDLRPLC